MNTAVSRLLRAKFEMGLFENPYPAAPQDQWHKLINSPEAVKVARDLDKESIVLLENHDDVLPLKKSGDIAVIGPMAGGLMNVRQEPTYFLSPSMLINRDYSTVTTLSTRVNIGASPPSMASRPQLAIKPRSTMPKDVRSGATTSQASMRQLKQQRSPTWLSLLLAPGRVTRASSGKD